MDIPWWGQQLLGGHNKRRRNIPGGGYGILGLAWIQGGGSVLAGRMFALGDVEIQDIDYVLAGAHCF